MTKSPIYEQVLNNPDIVTSIESLQQKIQKKQPFTLTQYIDYCYHTINTISHDHSKLKDQKIRISIEKINNHPVEFSPQKKPCFIYEHLFETFCSLAEADEDGDEVLVECQIQEIEECIGIYWGREEDSKSQYQDLAELEVKQLIQSDQLKEFAFKQLKLLIEEFKSESRESISPGTQKIHEFKPESQRKAKMSEDQKKKVQDWLNKRKEERAKVFGKLKGNTGVGVEEREKFLIRHYLEEIQK